VPAGVAGQADGEGPAGMAGPGLTRRSTGYQDGMRIGNVEVRPLGGGLGCLLMVLGSILLSVTLTVCANAFLR
jgi:hypothetical protein